MLVALVLDWESWTGDDTSMVIAVVILWWVLTMAGIEAVLAVALVCAGYHA